MTAIVWPDDDLPGTTDNFVSNEIIVAGLTAAVVWPHLSHPSRWPGYYDNAVDVVIHDGNGDTSLDVHHAWLLEDLPGGRVRILTQETQIGGPARELAATLPNPMLNAHQAWLDGLARSARQAQIG